MKKKIITLTLALFTLLTLLPLSAMAETATDTSCTVTVSIINGAPVMAAETVTVTDTDGDGKLTVNDALYCAHEKSYEGGAETGYASEESAFGVSLTKLWGDTSGAFSYCINNTPSYSLLDEVADNFYLTAYVYQDQLSWTDAYSYFDKTSDTVKAGETVTLTLSYIPDIWSPEIKLAEGAKITVNGNETDITVDMNGKATVKLTEAGTYLISATSNMNLVSPVCVVTVEADPTQLPPADSGNDTEEPENNIGWAIPLCAAVICAAAAVAVVLSNNNSKKATDEEKTENNEKNEDK